MTKEEKSVSAAESGDSSDTASKESATRTCSPEQEVSVTSTLASEESTQRISGSPSEPPDAAKAKGGRTRKRGRKWVVKEDYIDIIRDPFWDTKPWILGL